MFLFKKFAYNIGLTSIYTMKIRPISSEIRNSLLSYPATHDWSFPWKCIPKCIYSSRSLNRNGPVQHPSDRSDTRVAHHSADRLTRHCEERSDVAISRGNSSSRKGFTASIIASFRFRFQDLICFSRVIASLMLLYSSIYTSLWQLYREVKDLMS